MVRAQHRARIRLGSSHHQPRTLLPGQPRSRLLPAMPSGLLLRGSAS